jgi:hypothetical protein
VAEPLAFLAAGASATLTVRTTVTVAGTASNAVSVASASQDAVSACEGRPGQPLSAPSAAQVVVAQRMTPVTGSSALQLAGFANLLTLAGLAAVGGSRRRAFRQ